MSAEFPFDPGSRVISVAELNRSARALLEQTMPLQWVAGEISNLRRYESGHWYFVLKDADAQVRCVMFRQRNMLVDWRPADGMRVEVRATVTLYEPRGDFQLGVETMRRAGLGALYEAFERLKARLQQEGLFDAARKRALPSFPRQVGVVTSTQAAALRDVLTTLRRRMPGIPVVIYPTPVQGEGAARSIARAIGAAGRRGECEVLIVCRGGGSIEDLWAFNEEEVARAIAACPIPVVSGVGHETDTTIADFVADRRAPTPTAAAELVSPLREELLARLRGVGAGLERALQRSMERRMQAVDLLSRRLLHPGERLRREAMHAGHLGRRLAAALARRVEGEAWRVRALGMRLARSRPDLQARAARSAELGRRLGRATALFMDHRAERLARLQAHLEHLSPMQVLERGYGIVEHRGGVVRDAATLAPGDELSLTFYRGRARSRVTGIE